MIDQKEEDVHHQNIFIKEVKYFLKKEKEMKITNEQKEFTLEPDFIESNIVVPDINQKLTVIHELLTKMNRIYGELINDHSDHSKAYTQDFISMIQYYYKTTPNLKDRISEDNIHSEAMKLKQQLLGGISIHLEQYLEAINNLRRISSTEKDIKKIQEYMISVHSFMLNITSLKNKIFNIIVPLTTIATIDKASGKEIDRLHKHIFEGKVTKIGLVPFEQILDEISSFCENGIKNIDSWFDHLKNKKIQHIENIVYQAKVQASQEQAKAAKNTFYTQIGFMVLSVLFIISSFVLSEYKEVWTNLFSNKPSINKTLSEKITVSKKPLANSKSTKKEDKILKQSKTTNIDRHLETQIDGN